ncbi:protein MOR1, partial [Tanacetum coccineum]
EAAAPKKTIMASDSVSSVFGGGLDSLPREAFLSDVMPAVLSVVEAECEKNPFEGEAAAPKKTVMASDSVSSVFGGGLDSLPREANSGKITPELLKGFECSDWKMRFESIEAVKIVEETNMRIEPTGTVELFRALGARLYDSNQNLIMATLTSISGLPSAMGPAIQKSSKGIVSDIVKCIGDNNKHMGECTLATFDSWVASTDLDKVQYITPSMTDAKLGADGRTNLFDGLSKQLAIQLRPKIGKSKRTDARTFQTLAAAKMLTPTGPTGQTHWGDSMPNNPMPAAHFCRCPIEDTDQSLKATSKIEKSNGYGSKPKSRAVSLSVEGMKVLNGNAEVTVCFYWKYRLVVTIVEAKGYEFLAPTLVRKFLLEASPGVGKTSLVLALGKFFGHSGLRINLSEQVIAEYFRRRNSWPKTNSVEGMKVVCQEFEAISTAEVPSASTEIPFGNAMEIDKSDLTFGIHPFYIEKRYFLKNPVLLEASPGVGKTSLVLALGKFSGHSGLRINLSEQVIAEYFRRRNSWPKTNV